MSPYVGEPTEPDVGPRSLEARRLVAFWDGGSIAKALPAHGSVVLGRSLDCDLPIDHKSVSRAHARLHLGPELAIEDLGSANGTRVRGRAIAQGERARVAWGEVIEVGAAMVVAQTFGAPLEPPAPERRAPVAAPTIPPPSRRVDAAGTGDFIVLDPAMQQLHRLVGLVARTAVSVLVCGETGAGKDVIANAIHRLSPRSAAKIVCLNCAAMPEALLESELFGHERGAFTGADKAKPGLLEAADGGTVFLDEIGEMPLPTQAKLLRVVENRQVTRLGSLNPIAIDVRFISATNVDLEARAAAGAFRRDLYFRLNGITLMVPPLRERVTEIVPLAKLFVAQAAAAADVQAPELSIEVQQALKQYAWPGNLRELKNVIGQAIILAEGGHLVEVRHLPGQLCRPPTSHRAVPAEPARGLRGELDAIERARIVEALEQCSGNQTRAAMILGISRRTLLSRLDAYGLPRPRK